MKLPDWLLLAINAILLFFAFMGVASVDTDVLMVTSMLAMVTAAINGVVVFGRRKGRDEPLAKRRVARSSEDEMDARTVLDIDARLEALERREREAADAERIRQMVARGEQSAPETAPLAESATPQAAGRERV
ncbi:hypothetical protein [Rubricoccus marinus]|uniref:Uncharacterized protein n=1 Tax=Rubricoccus marinus TaxID=716817 RepID=A0A259TXC5_9BACT|nr:hypothetical protein [Rubricoccus marinus]OZC02224.1 hypothetical protein BSZ36_04010 [Rubricoccus marinus]